VNAFIKQKHSISYAKCIIKILVALLLNYIACFMSWIEVNSKNNF